MLFQQDELIARKNRMWENTDNRWIETKCNAYNNILGDLTWYYCLKSQTSLFFADGKAFDEIPEFNVKITTDDDNFTLYAVTPNVFVEKYLEPDATDGGGVFVITGLGCWFRTDGIVAAPRNMTYENPETGETETLGIRYWEGEKFDILEDAITGKTITLTEVNGKGTTATLEIQPKHNIGWWTNTDSSGVFGFYQGEGAYEGESRYFGTPTWTNTDYNTEKILAYGTDSTNRILIESSYIRFCEDKNKFVIGTINDKLGWYECNASSVKIKSDLTFTAMKGEEGGPEGDLIFTWKGFSEDPIDTEQHWIMDVPAWR